MSSPSSSTTPSAALEPTEPFREAALVVGRRGGKSRVLALVAVFLAAFRDYTPYLGAGEVATIAVIAANRMQARTIFRYVLGLLEAVPALKAHDQGRHRGSDLRWAIRSPSRPAVGAMPRIIRRGNVPKVQH